LTGYQIEGTAGFLLAKAYQRFFACFRDGLEPFGITPPQFALLAFLWQQDGLSQTELADKTEVDRTTLSGMVDRLQKLELVERLRHPSDRRVWLVQLTAAGREMESQLVPIALQVRERLAANLEDDEYLQLCVLLKKLRKTSDA
jgi:MarR family transcriptional regulator, lower aerobic nicotinate degradation pathway regulator